MASQPWRNRLIAALHRQGLPNAYVDRMVEELSDHATDLFLEDPSMDAQKEIDARLGTPEQLAAVAKIEFQRRTFAGRHPILTFIAGPLVAVIGTLVANFLLVVGTCELLDLALGGALSANDGMNLPPSGFEVSLMRAMNCVVRFIPFALSAWLFVRLGRCSGRRIWSIVACGIVAVAAIFFWSVVTPGTAQSRGTWMMGIGWNIGLDQLLQAAVPAALAAWMLWRSSASRPKMLSA
jgi:hypothetical protein